ncbi:hypothetical protein HN446_01750 [bacterium]|jgi:hypothetical protein|nr:hypothetical protein [bacterium]
MAKQKTFSFLEAIKFAFINLFEHFAIFLKTGLTYFAFFAAFIGLVVGFIIFTINSIESGLNTVAGHIVNHPVVQAFKMASLKPTTFHVRIHDKFPIGEILIGLRFVAEHASVIILFFIIFWLIQTGLKLGFTKINLDIYDKKPPVYKDLFSCFGLIGRAVVASFLYSLMVGFGLLLFVIPGIIFAIKFGFYLYAIIEEDCGIIDSLKRSSQITNGAKWQLLSFHGLLIFVCTLLTSIAIGVIVAVPVFMLAEVYAYKKLKEQT